MSDELKTCGAAGPDGAECDLEPHDFGMHRGWDQMGKRFDWGPHKPEFQHSPEPWNVVQTLGGDWYLTDCEDDYPVVVEHEKRAREALAAVQGMSVEQIRALKSKPPEGK